MAKVGKYEGTTTTGETGGGDEIKISNSNKNFMEDEDPDRITSLGFEEISLSEEGKQPSSVYRPCSVTSESQEMNGIKEVLRQLHQQEQPPQNAARTSSTWSVGKFMRDSWFRFKCCGKGDYGENNEQGIELDSLYAPETKDAETVDEVDVMANSENGLTANNVKLEFLPMCSIGPVMTVDCSKFSVEEDLERLKSSLGDVIRKLIIRNFPIESAIKIVHEPLLYENVTTLHIENCDMSVRDLYLILGSLKCVEQLHVGTKNMDNGLTSLLLQEDFHNSRGAEDYFSTQLDRVFESAKSLEFPKRLKRISISLPMIWQCSLVCQAIEVMLKESRLEEIDLKSSLTEMIGYLASTDGVNFDDEKTWRDVVTLGARNLIEKNSSTLKILSISCADNFPLQHLKMSEARGVSIKDIYEWSFYCTCGVLNAITTFNEDDKNPHLLLPVLTNLDLDLPLLPIIMAREDFFRKPLNAIAGFLARNNGIHVVKLHGLRPEKGMENWIRNSLVTIPKYRMNIGCTYTSTTLASNMPVFDDELGSLGLEIVSDETRRRVTDIIDPSGLEVIPLNWKYTGMKAFHLVNQLPSLISYDLDRIASKFNKLTKLVIEDFAVSQSSYDEDNGVMIRTLNDNDMQTIFQQLVLLEYLHLDCNMRDMTDRGLTGITDSLWSRLTQKEKKFSFWYLNYLKYVYLKGFGVKVTDKSAVHAFSEEFSLKNLQELHLFAPGFTNYGREKIRRAYAGRNGFILRLPDVK